MRAKELRSPEYFRSCKGKVRFESLTEAWIAAEDYNRNRRVLTFGDYIMSAYPCTFCRHSHIGHRRT